MPSSHRVDRYAEAVLDGGILAGPLVRKACERHRRDRAAASASWYQFSEHRADDLLDFFETCLRLPDSVDADGDPLPFSLSVGSQFWGFILGSLAGWVDRAGVRRFREAYIEAGKGSAKTPVLAGLGLFGLMMDGERAAEIYAAAADQDQAGIMFRDAVRIAEASPEIRNELEFDGGAHVWQIRHPDSLSFFRTFSREGGQKSGPRPHMGLLDELHEHPNAQTSTKIRAGAKRRKQPLFIEITNSGFDRTSICWQRHEHSRRVVERVISDDQLFAYVCALDEGEDPLTSPACWPKTNPYIGVTVTEEYLRRQVENAKNIPAETNNVLRLNFCVWTQANVRYFDINRWVEGAVSVPDSELAGRPCFGAFDLGSSDDFSAWARIWVLDDGRIAVKMRYWLPRVALERHPHRPYAEWERSGLLTVTDGETTSYDVVEQQIIRDCQSSGVLQVGYDERFAGQMAQHLEGAGLEPVKLLQGFQLNEAIKRTSEIVVERKICHAGDPILMWMADNSVAHFGRNGEVRLDKDRSKDKIDGIVALVMAVGLMQKAEESPYATEGIFVL